METNKLLDAIERYKKAKGYTDSTVSNKLMGNGTWLAGIREGKSMTIKSWNKCVATLEAEGFGI